ncbi:MAG: hypothetical protein KAS46_04970 [Candidatus Aureabacteria bacterium]|nr:hypothetical protein [Candidatus Auribacterota bacterium]
MRICAISPLESSTSKEILHFLGNCDHDLVVLPGNAKNHPSYIRVSKVLKSGVLAFVETGSGKGRLVPWLVSPMQKIKMPNQIFATKPTARNLDRLQDIWPERTHRICNRMISFAICGEIDGFAKNGLVKAGRDLPYDILVNPTHTMRGRWNHLGPKLENLSAGTAVVHVANNNYNHHEVTTNVRIYVSGVVMNRKNSGGIAWSECEI